MDRSMDIGGGWNSKCCQLTDLYGSCMLHSTNEDYETTCESNAQVEMNKIVQTFDELLPTDDMRG